MTAVHMGEDAAKKAINLCIHKNKMSILLYLSLVPREDEFGLFILSFSPSLTFPW